MDAPDLNGGEDKGLAPGTPGAGLVPVQRQVPGWDKKGNPILLTVPVLTKTQVVDMVVAAVARPYFDPDDELAVEMGLPPSRFYGHTNMEVMLMKLAEAAAQTGDRGDVDALLDRILGKPKQTSETVKTTMTYEERLREIARQDVAGATPIINAEATATTAYEDEL